MRTRGSSTHPGTAKLLRILRQVSRIRREVCALTLQELGALVVQAGCEAGFVVQVEVPAPHNRRRRGKVDCAWLALNRRTKALEPVVAWEFDGRDVGRGHVAGDKRRQGNIRKLRALRPLLMIQALYSFRDKPLPCTKDGTLHELSKAGVVVVYDAELLDGAVFVIGSLAVRGTEMLGLSVIERFSLRTASLR